MSVIFVLMYQGSPNTAANRVLITHSAFMSVSGVLEKDATATPAKTVEGSVEFHQNPGTLGNSKYKVSWHVGDDERLDSRVGRFSTKACFILW